MNLALWIVAIVLAVVFAGSGLMKQFVRKDKLVTSGQGWAQDVSQNNIRLIGLAEILDPRAGRITLATVYQSWPASRPDLSPKVRRLRGQLAVTNRSTIW